MKFKKKAQGTIEFIILFGALLLFFIGFLSVIQKNIGDKNEEKERIILQNVVLNIKEEINMAAESSDGYFREFKTPQNILGKDYEIIIESTFIYATMEKEGFSYKIHEVNGNITKGENNITKENGTIYLNKE